MIRTSARTNPDRSKVTHGRSMNALRTALFLLVAAASALGAAPARADEIQVRAVRHGSEIALSRKDTMAANVVAMLESCTINSTENAVAEGTWTQQLAGDSFVHVAFAQPREVYV